MATWLLTASPSSEGLTLSAGAADRWVPPAGHFDVDQTNISRARVRVRDSLSIERLFVRVSANSLTAASTVVLRVVITDTSLSVTIPAGLTGVFRNDTNTVSTVANNVNVTRVITGATGGSITYRLISYLYTNASTQRIFITTHGAPGITWPSGITEFTSIEGVMGRDTSDSVVQYTFRALNGVGTTLTNMRVRIEGNAIPNASTLTIRRNGANGALSVNIPANLSGDFDDTTNSETYAGGDEANYQLATGAGGGSLDTHKMVVHLDGPQRFTIVNGIATTSGGSSAFDTIEGATGGSVSELNVQQEARNSFQARNYFVRVRGNTLNGEFRSNLRVNGASSLLGIIVPTGLTGVFEDADNVVDVSALDDVNVSKDASAASTGSITPGYIGFGYIEAPTPAGEPQEPVPGHTSWGIGRRVEMLPY